MPVNRVTNRLFAQTFISSFLDSRVPNGPALPDSIHQASDERFIVLLTSKVPPFEADVGSFCLTTNS